MPLQRAEREVLLNGGMDVKQSTELQDEMSLRGVTNLRWDSLGELRKRPTYASTATPAAPSGADYDDATPECLFTRGREVFALTKDLGVGVIDPTANTSVIMARREMLISDTVADEVVKYAPRACKVSRRFVERAQFGEHSKHIEQVVSAVYGNHMVIAWTEVNQTSTVYLKFKAVDVDTGTVLSTVQYKNETGVLYNLCAMPYLVGGSEGVLITYAAGTAAPYTIKAVTYNASTREFAAAGDLTTNAKFVGHTIANAPTGDSKFYLAFCDNTSSFLTCEYRTVAVVTTTHTGSAANPQFFSLAVHSAAVLIASATPATAAYCEVFGTPANRITLFSVSSESFFGLTCSLEDTTERSAVVYVNRYGSTSPTAFGVKTATVTFPSTTPIAGLTGLAPNTWLAAGAFSMDSRSYVPLVLEPFNSSIWASEGALNTSVILCRYYESTANSITRVEPVARLGHDRCFAANVGSFGGAPSATVSGRKVHLAITADASADKVAFGLYGPQSIFHATVEFPNDAMPLTSAQADGTTVIASGLALEWDGDLISEHAPLCKPRISATAYTVIGVGNTFAQTATTTKLTDPGAVFPANSVGRTIAITGSTSPANNGTFTIISRVSDTEIWWTNAAGVAEAFPGDWVFTDVAGGIEGTYSIKAILRWVDAAGRLHRSAPSDAVSVTTTAQSEIRVNVARPMFYSYTGSVAQFMDPEIYMTEDGPGSSYYLANDDDGVKSFTLAAVSSDYHWVADRVGDVDGGVPGNPPLYTDSGELEAEPPPAFHCIATIGDRMWAIDAEDRSRIWFTKPFAQGYAPEWSTTCTLVVGDDCVAVVDVSGVPTLFATGGVWQIFGEGPNALGQGYFSPARRLPFEIGCIDPLVCRTSLGAVFRGRRGFNLFTGAGIEPLGMPIDPVTRTPSIADYTYARVVFDEVHNEIRIVDNVENRQWVYNFVERKWSEWTQSASAQNAVDMVVADGRVWYLHLGASSTSIRREYGVDEGDAAAPSSEGWSVQTPWIKTNGLAGFGRLWELHLQMKVRDLGVYDTTAVAALTVVIETTGVDAGTDTFTWTGSELNAIGSVHDQTIDLEMRPRYQRCKSFRVTVTETMTDLYHGSSPISLRLVMGVDGKVMRQRKSGSLKGAT